MTGDEHGAEHKNKYGYIFVDADSLRSYKRKKHLNTILYHRNYKYSKYFSTTKNSTGKGGVAYKIIMENV